MAYLLPRIARHHLGADRWQAPAASSDAVAKPSKAGIEVPAAREPPEEGTFDPAVGGVNTAPIENVTLMISTDVRAPKVVAAIDVGEAAALEAFRRRCRAFLERHATGFGSAADDDARGERRLAVARRFQRALFARGLAGLNLPVAQGGRGLDPVYECIWREEAGRYPLMTESLSITLGNCLPLLSHFGTPEQQARHIPRMVAGEEVWCQLFSEPDAGSDLANVQTRAARRDGGWVISGQKVWTTLAHVCDFGVLLARTDPSRPKHRGLSMFVVDMHAPGIEVRPIHQIDGGLEFNEVFLTDVVLLDSALVPPENEGWRLATAMLGFQRASRGTGQVGGVRTERADRLIVEARTRGVAGDPVTRQELAELYTAEVCHSVMAERTRAALAAGAVAPTGSLAKLAGALIAARYRDLSLRIVGPEAVAWNGEDGERWARDALYAVSMSISGGTNEIQRNIIGERVLGLPRDP